MVLLSPPLVFVVPALCMLGMARSLVPVTWCPRCEGHWPRSVVACVGSLREGEVRWKCTLMAKHMGFSVSVLAPGIWYHLRYVGFEKHKGHLLWI